jgi:hypothetical protein
MDRINHVKVVTPEPELVDAFLREVCEIPEGWPLSEQSAELRPGPLAPLGPGGEITMEEVMGPRGPSDAVGFITGDSTSRQFQIFKSAGNAAFWAVCIGTRNIEAATRSAWRGIPAADHRRRLERARQHPELLLRGGRRHVRGHPVEEGSMMKIGLTLQAVNPKFWVAAPQEAEQAGFESVWVPEHLVLPVKMSGSPHRPRRTADPPSMPAYDVWVSLPRWASTSTIRLATHVFNIGLRHPFITCARSRPSTSSRVGGVELGIGASWLEEEWDAMQLDFATRGRRASTKRSRCAAASGPRTSWAPRGVLRLPAGDVQPKPIQQPIPSSWAATSPAALRHREPR